ncbi:MAG: M14 family zinc carboxypeptidase [Gemmatimonadota bacterium]
MEERTLKDPRRGRGSLPSRLSLAAAALFLLSCGGGTPVPEAPAPPPGAAPADLIRIHEAMMVPGLEDRRFTHAVYWDAVAPYLAPPLRVERVGESAEGREIRMITFGRGPVTILLWSQMHGNESTASMALADVARFFHDWPDHPLARRIAAGATVHMIPMLNPDGAQRFRRRNAQGIDINRDARRLQTPEGRTLKAVRDRLEPDFGFNLHDQNAAVRVGDSDRGVAIALLAPAFNQARDVDTKRHRAMQVASLIVQAIRPLVGDHVAKYDDTFNPRAFGDLMGKWGASTVLIESGAWENDPQKQYLRRTNFIALLSALEGIATGRYARYDPHSYQSLVYNGRRMPDLLIRGGKVAVPGLPTLAADILVTYERPLLREGGVISDIGDLGEREAQDTLNVTGLYLVPMPKALDETGALDVGRPAWFAVAEDAEGRRVRMRFEGGPPRGRE